MKSVLLRYVAGAALACGLGALVLSLGSLAIGFMGPKLRDAPLAVFDLPTSLSVALFALGILLARTRRGRISGLVLAALAGLGGLIAAAAGDHIQIAVSLGLYGAAAGQYLRRNFGIAQAATALALLSSLGSIIGHLLGTEILFGRLPLLALLTIMLCGGALLGNTAHRGSIRVFLSKTISGRFARQQILIATFVPIALAVLFAQLLPAGGEPLALAETVAGIIVAAWITIGVTALVGRRLDIKRHRAEAELRNLARHDALTGLLNRRSMNSALPVRHAEAQRDAQPITLMMCDLDHFKHLNDEYGHAMGDEVLRRTAQRISAAVRDSDLVFRYGGEEIAVLLDCGSGDAIRIAEKIRAAVKTRGRRAGDSDIPGVTISIGAATSTRAATEMKAILEAADECLYAAKDAGRDCVRHVSLP